MRTSSSRTAAQLLAALRVLVVLSVVLGVAYPLAVLGIGQVAFPGRANGSMVESDGRVVGSSLIGQSFTDPATGAPLPQWFQSRPSAAGDGYDPTSTAASNLGPQSVGEDGLLGQVCARSAEVGALDGVPGGRPYCASGDPAPGARGSAPADSAVPPDAVTASGSGLDPDVSPAYARLQVDRVAQARGLPVEQVRALVDRHVEGRTLGFLGEPRVNVLALNLALQRLAP